MKIEKVETVLPKLKEPEVTLFAHTNKPLSAITLAIEIWHNDLPSQDQLMLRMPTDAKSAWGVLGHTEGMADRVRWLFKQPHQTPFEYFQMTWVFKNVSRAFQQQLTRHRIASYSIQSLRVVDVGNFATEGRYHMPETVENKEQFHEDMLTIQHMYNRDIQDGESIEDARGKLPLNIHSPITMNISYRALVGLMRQRMCVAAQEEWRKVVEQMREAITEVHPVFAEPLDCMCNRFKNGKGICKTTHEKVKG